MIYKHHQGTYHLKYDEFIEDDQDQFFSRLDKIRDRLIVIDFSDLYCGEGTVMHYHSVLTNLNYNFVILSCCPIDHQAQPNIFYYPFWQIDLLHNINHSITFRNERTYKVSCPNKNPRPHRILNYLLLKNKSFFKEIFFTLQDAFDPHTYMPWDMALSQEHIAEWESIKNNFPKFDIGNYNDINDPIWTDSYVNLVTENMVTQAFVTEKIWKPIVSEQLFLIFGYPGIVSYLRDIGVDTFDDIIDHNSYDKISDPQDRLNCLHSVLENLIDLDLKLIFNQTAERRRNNRLNFLAGKFTNNYIDIINHKIQEMLN